MAQTEPTQTEPTQTEPTQTEPTQTEPTQPEFAQPAFAQPAFTLQTAAVTLAELDGDCQRHALLPDRIEPGAVVPCPDGDHEHRVLDVLHTEAAENIRIIE